MWSQLWIAYIWCETSLNSNTQIHNYKNTQIQKAQFFQHVTVLGGRECEVCSLTNYFWFLQFLEDDLILLYKVVRIEHFVRISRLCSLIFLSIIDIVLATVELTVQRDIAREGLSYVFIGRLCSLIFILQSSTFSCVCECSSTDSLASWILCGSYMIQIHSEVESQFHLNKLQALWLCHLWPLYVQRQH